MPSTAHFSSLLFSLLAVAGGLVMLVGGGEALINGASKLARRFGMSPLVIGLTVVAFGTSVPELFVSLTASLKGHPDIMIGNVIGSNIANIGLILGFSALLSPLRLRMREVWIELLLVIAGSVFLVLLSGYGFFNRAVGLLFILTLITYTFFTYRNSLNRHVPEQEPEEEPPSFIVPCFVIIIGLILLALGSTLFIRGAIDIARHIGVSELVIGLTLAAIGTSLPELASSLAALRHREPGLLIGNIIGSNMFNLFMVLGLTGLILPFPLDPSLLHRDLPVMLAFSLALIAILMRNEGTKRWHGVLFLTSYALYCSSLI